MKATSLNSFYHAEITELYYVIRGEGTALLGGELENPRWSDPNSTGTAISSAVWDAVKWNSSRNRGANALIIPHATKHTVKEMVPSATWRAVGRMLFMIVRLESRSSLEITECRMRVDEPSPAVHG